MRMGAAEIQDRIEELEAARAESDRKHAQVFHLIGEEPSVVLNTPGKGLLKSMHETRTSLDGLVAEMRADREAKSAQASASGQRWGKASDALKVIVPTLGLVGAAGMAVYQYVSAHWHP